MAHESQLHGTLTASHARIALITSDEFYRTVVAPGPRGLDPSTFARVTIAAQDEQCGTAWISVVGYPWPPGVTEEPEQRQQPRGPSNSRPENPGAGQSGGFSFASNPTFNVTGDMVGRDKIVY